MQPIAGFFYEDCRGTAGIAPPHVGFLMPVQQIIFTNDRRLAALGNNSRENSTPCRNAAQDCRQDQATGQKKISVQQVQKNSREIKKSLVLEVLYLRTTVTTKSLNPFSSHT